MPRFSSSTPLQQTIPMASINKTVRWRYLYRKRYGCKSWRSLAVSVVVITWAGGSFLYRNGFLLNWDGDMERSSLSHSALLYFEQVISSLSLPLKPSSIILIHDQTQHRAATLFRPYSWVIPLSVHPSSLSVDSAYFHTYFMNHFISHLTKMQAVLPFWIGSFFIPSTSTSYLNLSLVDEMLADQRLIHNDDVNLLTFAEFTGPDQSPKNRLDTCLPGAFDALKHALLDAGEDLEDINSMELLSPGFKAFHGDFFVTRPYLMQAYTDWLANLLRIIESNQAVQAKFQKSLKQSPLRSLFNFIFRRCHSPPVRSMTNVLASYYFHRTGANIMTMSEYKRQRETEMQRKAESQFMETWNAVTLSKIPKTNSKNPIVFILSHNNETAYKSVDTFSNFSWAYPYVIPRTFYFETYFYSHLMGDVLKSTQLTSDWIGSLSWKANIKTNLTVVDMMLFDPSVTSDYDLLGFFNPEVSKTLWKQAGDSHPSIFLDLLEYTLLSVGESKYQIDMMKEGGNSSFQTFYGSFFVTRPQFLRKYVEWLGNIIQFLESDRIAQNLLWRDSNYHGDLKAARIVYDLPFYPMHPFLGERLVQYYFNSRGARILTAEKYLEVKVTVKEREKEKLSVV